MDVSEKRFSQSLPFSPRLYMTPPYDGPPHEVVASGLTGAPKMAMFQMGDFVRIKTEQHGDTNTGRVIAVEDLSAVYRQQQYRVEMDHNRMIRSFWESQLELIEKGITAKRVK
jgi:hypothetical protein